ncbi:MAG TPA: alpha/beta fold hydrolase [Myxococcota bacterium]|nr:alpha/beta fold hydrolase [Myxococcota bacterium]HRY96683.1 alpha/beta fold hydrolase [Myxococcota bacterium]HSA20579.1 alpha/beta fold hydrolase [Myxococcota bacterium]
MPTWLLSLLVLVCLGLAGLGAWLWRTRPWRGPRPRWPVVLVHGILGFDRLELGPLRRDYFHGVVEHLRDLGVEVHCPRLPPLGGIAERAEALAAFLRALPARKVNLVAHSMGGLDARWAISRLGCAPRVASLTTLGTPHRGTPAADLGVRLLGLEWGVGALLSAAGLPGRVLTDLSVQGLARFDAEAPDAPGVRYFCVPASADATGQGVHPLLRPLHAYLQRAAGPNDGLVPAASQVHGQVLARVRADHWAEIGWGQGLDAPALFVRLLTELRRRGR